MTSRDADVRVVEDAGEIADVAARLFVAAVRIGIAERGVARVALSGGSTPRALYERLAAAAVAAGAGANGSAGAGIGAPGAEAPEGDAPLTAGEWARLDLFFGDERFVPADHQDSNYRMVRESGLAGRAVSEARVHRVPTDLGDPQAAADRYAEMLREQFQLRPGEWPRFDLVLLGMGADGHTASLFPGTDVVKETRRLVAPVWVERLRTWRITLTAPVLNHARRTVLLVAGADKAETLASVIEGPWAPERWPVQGVRPAGQSPVWLVDRAASARLSRLTLDS